MFVGTYEYHVNIKGFHLINQMFVGTYEYHVNNKICSTIKLHEIFLLLFRHTNTILLQSYYILMQEHGLLQSCFNSI